MFLIATQQYLYNVTILVDISLENSVMFIFFLQFMVLCHTDFASLPLLSIIMLVSYEIFGDFCLRNVSANLHIVIHSAGQKIF
jgi:hypothetical protein